MAHPSPARSKRRSATNSTACSVNLGDVAFRKAYKKMLQDGYNGRHHNTNAWDHKQSCFVHCIYPIIQDHFSEEQISESLCSMCQCGQFCHELNNPSHRTNLKEILEGMSFRNKKDALFATLKIVINGEQFELDLLKMMEGEIKKLTQPNTKKMIVGTGSFKDKEIVFKLGEHYSMRWKISARFLREKKHEIKVDAKAVRGDIAQFWFQNWCVHGIRADKDKQEIRRFVSIHLNRFVSGSDLMANARRISVYFHADRGFEDMNVSINGKSVEKIDYQQASMRRAMRKALVTECRSTSQIADNSNHHCDRPDREDESPTMKRRDGSESPTDRNVEANWVSDGRGISRMKQDDQQGFVDLSQLTNRSFTGISETGSSQNSQSSYSSIFQFKSKFQGNNDGNDVEGSFETTDNAQNRNTNHSSNRNQRKRKRDLGQNGISLLNGHSSAYREIERLKRLLDHSETMRMNQERCIEQLKETTGALKQENRTLKRRVDDLEEKFTDETLAVNRGIQNVALHYGEVAKRDGKLVPVVHLTPPEAQTAGQATGERGGWDQEPPAKKRKSNEGKALNVSSHRPSIYAALPPCKNLFIP